MVEAKEKIGEKGVVITTLEFLSKKRTVEGRPKNLVDTAVLEALRFIEERKKVGG